jgi:hypothetical protein
MTPKLMREIAAEYAEGKGALIAAISKRRAMAVWQIDAAIEFAAKEAVQ